jgi:hypothetical protein
VCLATACESRPAPAAPAGGGPHFSIPAALEASIALIDSDLRPVPIINESAGAWLRRQIKGVVLDSALPSGVRAQCCGADRIVHWSTEWMPDPASSHDVRVAAAILIHEARHAEGYRHSCPDQRRDRTFDEGGPWAVHATWLRHAGDERTADSITVWDIGCR